VLNAYIYPGTNHDWPFGIHELKNIFLAVVKAESMFKTGTSNSTILREHHLVVSTGLGKWKHGHTWQN
jgi:hypothetical protein